MLALTDHQLELLQAALASLDNEAARKRLLELVGDACRVRTCDLETAIASSLREVSAMTRFGDLLLPPNCVDVTSEKSGTMFAIIGPPYRPKQK
jgi:hypothetical protein